VIALRAQLVFESVQGRQILQKGKGWAKINAPGYLKRSSLS